MLELAARSIGGLCSRALRFPGGTTLEELILASALGRPVPAASRDPARPAGVYMLPVPRAGRAARHRGPGQRRGRARDHRPDHHHPGRPAGPPAPGRGPYLGFIFAEAATRHEVEQALTAARDQLRVIIQ